MSEQEFYSTAPSSAPVAGATDSNVAHGAILPERLEYMPGTPVCTNCG